MPLLELVGSDQRIDDLLVAIALTAENTAALRKARPGRNFPRSAGSEPIFSEPPYIPLFTSGARDVHTAAFATPVFGPDAEFMAALTLSGPASRLNEARETYELIAPQLQAASDLSRRLGASMALCERMYGIGERRP